MKLSLVNPVAIVTAALSLAAAASASASSLEFFGNGVNDIDRVKIQIDDPANSNPGPPADIGAEDFTIEFWIKPAAGNTAGGIACGDNYAWINGNIVFDRDRFNQGRTFGISLGAGRVVFGVQNGASAVRTVCGSTDLRDGAWHHVAAQRRRSDGFLWLYVDGTLEASVDGPDGDISYPDDGVPGNFCSGPCDFSDPFIVIGAEKHDAGAAYPSYFGLVDEIRLSNSLRYSGNSFTPSSQPFVADPNTVGLYHFDGGSGTQAADSSNGGLSPGVLSVGGNPAGPQWVADTPFSGGGSPGTLQFSASSYAVPEGGGNQAITVTRTGGSTGAVTIDYATSNGSATSGADYSPSSGTLNWADGVTTSQSFNVTVLEDNEVEGDETVNLALSNATGNAAIGARNTAILTISDNDAAPQPGTIEFAMAAYSVIENGGNATISVARRNGVDGAVSVDFQTSNGTASSGSDYQQSAGTLNWLDGDNQAKSFSITIIDDADNEPSETVMLGLGNPGGGAALGARATATLTINDDENPGTIAFSTGSYFIAENGGSASITVTRSGGSNGAVSIDYSTSNGSASSGSDYTASNGTLSWADGEAVSKSFAVPINNDTADENNESVVLILSNPGGGASLGSPATATLTINDDDTAAPTSPKPRSGGGGTSDPLWLCVVVLLAFARRQPVANLAE